MLVLCCLIVVCSCTNFEDTRQITLNLQDKNDKVPELGSAHIVRLEKNDNSLIGEITKVEYFDSKYYVLDIRYSKSLMVFDSLGNFLNKTKHGRGPGEVISPWSFTIDESKGCVFLWDQTLRRMSTYNLQLEYQDSYTNNKILIRDFEIYTNGNLFTYTQNIDLSDSSNNQQYYYYYLNNPIQQTVQSYLPGDRSFGNYILRSPICKNGNKTLLITPFDFHIYSFDGEVIKPYVFIDFGQYGLNSSMIEKNNFLYHSLVENGSKIVSMDYLMFSDQLLAFSYFQDGKRQFIIYDFLTSEIYYSQLLFEHGLIPECKLQCLQGDNFIGFIEPSNYIKATIENPAPYYSISNPDIMDNPYLINFSLLK